jgi:UDP-N-acetylglucosamine 2-epimerase (non-hydrolysing)
MSRRLTTQLTTLHLAPTAGARAHLLAEGVPQERVVVTGNTVIDALHWSVLNGAKLDAELEAVVRGPERIVLVTTHRRESWGAAMRAIGGALADLARAEPNVRIVIPIHRNPVVREALLPALEGLPNVVVVEPLPYGPFCRLMAGAHLILTDIGGIQEEAPSLGKPVLVMRETTERPEGLATGSARLVGTDPTAIVGAVRTLLNDPAQYSAMSKAVNPYGDGRGAERTLGALTHMLGQGDPQSDFHVEADLPSAEAG